MKTTQITKHNPLSTLTRLLPSSSRHPRHSGESWNPGGPTTPNGVIQRANRATASDYDRLHQTAGVGGDWAKSVYGEYYATSVSVYSAIKLRADAMARAPSPSSAPPLARTAPEQAHRDQAVSPPAPTTPSSNSSTTSTLGTPAATSGAPPRLTSASGAPPSGPSNALKTDMTSPAAGKSGPSAATASASSPTTSATSAASST